MKKYKITAYVGFDTHSKTVLAPNSGEAYKQALDYGQKMSNFGESFLRGVSVECVKQPRDTSLSGKGWYLKRKK